MDETDAATHQEEMARAAAMLKRHVTLPAVGQCYSCAEPIDGTRRFCDRECLEDWERMETGRRRREGGK
jgi:predicted nucleic acid-binding Zn ribbon protein